MKEISHKYERTQRQKIIPFMTRVGKEEGQEIVGNSGKELTFENNNLLKKSSQINDFYRDG